MPDPCPRRGTRIARHYSATSAAFHARGWASRILPLLLVCFGARPGSAQEPETLRIFLDCQAFGCFDFDFFRTEIDFVDWVRDREDSDVHVLISSVATGGGGRSYTVDFLGQDTFDGDDLSLERFTGATDTEDEIRRTLARVVRGGLVRYVAETAFLDRLDIRYQAPDSTARAQAAARPEDDPWNFWVFTVRAGANLNGQSTFSSRRFNGSLNARRTTEEWKLGLDAFANYSEDSFELTDRTSETFQRSYGTNAILVRSLASKWSLGGRASASHSTFLNQKLALRLAPGIEYNLFPYVEVTRRALTFQYNVGANHYDYIQETIFLRTAETFFDQRLTVRVDLTQPWGSTNFSIEGSTHLDDLSRNNVTLFGNVSFRLFRGLSLDAFGSYSRPRDQIFLAQGGATDDEILLRRRQLETTFQYFTGISLRYTFGSSFNNVVNPRFDGGGGFFFFN